ncbi:MAG: ATP-grasp domain-containing protein [Bacteroidales bacterium]|nr:ATP-grasp domain-containing protein [Bacteroidales bacterium]MCF8402966.1 ATP-grasp domain-containing protein [Bacteroidales bacterium]
MANKKYTIAVTGLNAIDSPGPGIAVIRGLRESASMDIRIIGLAYESLEPGIFMHDLIDKTYQIPYPGAGAESLLTRLEYIHQIEKLDVIIPNFDAELLPFIKLSPKLKDMGIRTFLPTEAQFEERHKINLPEFGKKYGIRVPHSKAIYSTSEIPSLVNEFNYPMVAKGKYYDAEIVHTPEQMLSCMNKISAKWGLPIIIQQYVKGTEYNSTGLGDGMGNTIAAVPMRKQYITDKGKAWGGISIDEKEIIDLTHHFIKSTKWRGGFELELIKDFTNTFYLLEVNPRMPAWIYLTVGVGQNIPEALAKLALSEKVKPYESYKVGKMFVRYSYDLIVDVDEFHKISTLGEL